jgi:hypothetical protein
MTVFIAVVFIIADLHCGLNSLSSSDNWQFQFILAVQQTADEEKCYNGTLIWGESWNYLHILDLVTFGRRMRRNSTLDRIP